MVKKDDRVELIRDANPDAGYYPKGSIGKVTHVGGGEVRVTMSDGQNLILDENAVKKVGS